MENMEKSGTLVQDANEGKWIVDSLQRIVNRDAPQEVKTRAEKLITAINQRLMSQYPLGSRVLMSEEQIWQDLEAAGYMRTPDPIMQRMEQRPEEEQKQEQQPPKNDDDEMAATAGRLLERVADNTSEKFQNSQFLGLMRRLRDREVRVQEDKIVEVDGAQQQQIGNITTTPQSYTHQQSPQQPPSTQIPAIDPTILSHAATDFEQPIYSSDEPPQYAHTPPRDLMESLITDEISEQYRYYNVDAAYHR
jgi:hypothetical protein